jgi:hypothetical protein
MSSSTYFVQECPICGRQLQIRVEYLGKRVIAAMFPNRPTLCCVVPMNCCNRLPGTEPGFANAKFSPGHERTPDTSWPCIPDRELPRQE